MYTPSFNKVDDRAVLIEAMRAYSFAALYGPDAEGVPTVTHLPLVITDEGEHGTIEGHFARANQHWRSLAEAAQTLVVFSGPHSYVSPTLYASAQSVPTWNYIAVHAYGKLELVEDDAGKDALLAGLIAANEPAFAEQWRAQTDAFRGSMLKGIVGFRIRIARIEGKFKLSQNKSDRDRLSVEAAHAAGSADERAMAAWMRRLDGR
jgi:transcriptional regulator